MDCQVWLRRDPKRGYVATVLGWPACEGLGTTEQEAVREVRAALERELAQGKVITVEVPLPSQLGKASNPWVTDAGLWRDDPQWDEFQAAISQHRQDTNASESDE